MNIGELAKTQLELISFKMSVLQERMMPFQRELRKLEAEGNAIIQKFCTENKLDIKKTNIDLQSGEVTLIQEKKVKKEK